MPPHVFRVDSKTLYAWCAYDTLFIPGLLGKTAHVTSRDPVTHDPISLTVAPDRISDLRPNDAVMSSLAPDQAFDRDVITNFCHFVHFFGSKETGAAWTAKHPGTFLLSLTDGLALAREANERNFGRVPASGTIPGGR